MAEKSSETLRQEIVDRPHGAEMNGTWPDEAQSLAERFDPFHDPYLADPYPFFAEARATTPVFYSSDLDYWVVTRYHDIEQIFRTPPVFSAVNALAPLEPICPAARRLLKNLAGSGGPVLAIALDVTDETQAQTAAAQALEHFGRIDVLVNNAGRGLLGAVEETSAEEVRDVFDMNVFGLLTVTRAVLPVMRRQR